MIKVTQAMVDNLVEPEHQYRGIETPLDPVRMAWPFKTEEELEILRKWYKRNERIEKKHKKDEMLNLGEATL